MSSMSLLLDQAHQPLCLLPMQEAVSRIALARVSGLHTMQALVSDPTVLYRSEYLEIPAPLVVRGEIDPRHYHKLAWREIKTVSRRVMFARDHYTCQYCGWRAESRSAQRELTLDHVKPARLFSGKEEATTWENVTTACRSCNGRKAGRLPMECGMMPRSTPRQPSYVQLRFAGRLNPTQQAYMRSELGWEGSF